MVQCPICSTAIAPNASVCPACGFNLSGATEKFNTISLDELKQNQVNKKPTLTIRYGRQAGLCFDLTNQPQTIGRDPKCDILLNDMTVSRIHAQIEQVGNAWVIKDMNSFNGVWLNNKSIDIASLRDGDSIQIGCFLLKYEE